MRQVLKGDYMKIFAGKYYFCKSEITMENMRKWNVPFGLNLDDYKQCFKICVELGYTRVFVTGSNVDSKKRRHTVFVELSKFKSAVNYYLKH